MRDENIKKNLLMPNEEVKVATKFIGYMYEKMRGKKREKIAGAKYE